jgi:hypothetical protein
MIAPQRSRIRQPVAQANALFHFNVSNRRETTRENNGRGNMLLSGAPIMKPKTGRYKQAMAVTTSCDCPPAAHRVFWFSVELEII